jgi:hypothetical protein
VTERPVEVGDGMQADRGGGAGWLPVLVGAVCGLAWAVGLRGYGGDRGGGINRRVGRDVRGDPVARHRHRWVARLAEHLRPTGGRPGWRCLAGSIWRDGASACCASSTSSTGGLRSPSRTTSQYGPCRIPNPASPLAAPLTPPGPPSRTAGGCRKAQYLPGPRQAASTPWGASRMTRGRCTATGRPCCCSA